MGDAYSENPQRIRPTEDVKTSLFKRPKIVPKSTEKQEGGDHYKKRKIQPIDYILANKLSFCEGNVVKYVTRWRDKGGLEDLKKARQYLDFLIEQVEQGQEGHSRP